MRNTLLIAAISWLIFCSFTDDPIKISVRDVLTSVQKERRVATNQQTVDFFSGLNYNLPIFKSVGLKYGTDDLTNAKGQYSTTFSLNSFKVIKEQKLLKNAQMDVYQAKKDLIVSQVIQERYANVVDAYFSQNILVQQKSLDTLLNQKNTVLKTSLQKGIPIKVKDLVETEDDIRGLQLALSSMDNIRTLSYQRIREYMEIQGSFILNFENFITVSKIEDILNNVKINRNLQTPELKISQSQMSLSQAELRLEEASFKQLFDGFQLIYEHKNKKEFTTQDFSFRVGFNIPIKGNIRPKQNELLLDMKEAENEYQLTFYEKDRQIKTQVLQIENLIKQYKLCQETLSSSLSHNLLNTPSVLATFTPSDIIDLKIIQRKKEIELAKIQYALMQEYIKLLNVTGELNYSPYKNYLSNSLDKW